MERYWFLTYLQEHKDYIPDAEVWYHAQRADPQALLSTMEEILLWESVKSLEARALRKKLERKFARMQRHSVLQQTGGNSSAGNESRQFDLSSWLDEHHEFDVDAWLKEQQQFPYVSDGNGSSVQIRDLSEWLDAQVSFDLDDWLSGYPDPEDLDGWLANSSSTSSVNISGWLDEHPLPDVEKWLDQQEGTRSSAFNMTRFLDEQPSVDMEKWLEDHPLEDDDAWLEKQENASDAFSLSKWLEEQKEVDINKWLQSARSETTSSQILLNRKQARRAAKTALKQRSLKMQLAQGGNSTAGSAFDLNAWLAEQPDFNLEEWLANNSGGGNSSIPLPEDDAADITPNGLCCCGLLCEEIAASCCGAWYPVEKQKGESKLLPKGLQKLKQSMERSKEQLAGRKGQASRTKAVQGKTSQKEEGKTGKFASLADMQALKSMLSHVMKGFHKEDGTEKSQRMLTWKKMSLLEGSTNTTEAGKGSRSGNSSETEVDSSEGIGGDLKVILFFSLLTVSLLFAVLPLLLLLLPVSPLCRLVVLACFSCSFLLPALISFVFSYVFTVRSKNSLRGWSGLRQQHLLR